jgi:flagellin-like hook-associated protein FlgL
MAAFPVQSTIGDPMFRSQSSSIDAVRRFSRVAADATQKLNNQERLVTPGDDALSFSASRRIRADISTLKTVQETGQLNVTGLSLAIEALESVKVQLDQVKRLLVQSQVADDSERDSIQAEIDLSLSQIDSTAHNTKLGSRSLLDGSSTIRGYNAIATNGMKTDFPIFANGDSLTANNGVTAARVNKVGLGGPTFSDNDGRSILSFQASIITRAVKPSIVLTAGAAGSFAEFRVTGKLGSATVRITSDSVAIDNIIQPVSAFNKLAQETGVMLTASAPTGNVVLSTVGFGGDEFVKVELINFSGNGGNPPAIGNVGGADAWVGDTQTAFGTAAVARVNGHNVELGGPNGTTARYLKNGFDIELDFSTVDLADATEANTITSTVHVDLTEGVIGLLGASGASRDVVHYGFGNFTTESLGRGNAQYSVTTSSTGLLPDPANALDFGQEIIGARSVADLGSGGSISLGSGNLGEAMRTIDRATDQVIREQTRLGVLQSNFVDAIQRAEVLMGNLGAADADIIGVDAATEIANLVQAQLGVQTATSLMAQANNMQSTVYSLLRG